MNRLPGDLRNRFEVQPHEEKSLSSVTVESSLTISGLLESDTGEVQCLMLHTISGELMASSSTANLVVLRESSLFLIVLMLTPCCLAQLSLLITVVLMLIPCCLSQ